MDLIIHEPFKLSLDIIELDDTIPSIKFYFSISATNMTMELNNFGEVWITNEVLSNFIKTLKTSLLLESELKSIDENFKLTLTKKDDAFFIGLNVKKIGIFNTSLIQSCIEFKLSEDDYLNISRKFIELEIFI